mmetsp:Transcript_7152/g.9053  ORF Transcript_7152/g.9053 Transcript_7152/m.9053 type:complete len:142 (+) Transcript_7152:894-1319(+)
MGPTLEFSKSITAKYPGDDETEFIFHKIEFNDKIILNVQINGVMDTTFDIPVSSKSSINAYSNISNSEDGGLEPVILIGDHSNLKIQVVASQIGKVVLASSEPKNLILSIGSKWFGKGNETDENDFNKLMFVLDNVKQLLK